MAAGALPYRRGVGIVLINPAGRIFVGRRSDTRDAWQMPQGGIEPGETPAEAALRELKEETGTGAATVLGESRDWLRYDLPEPIRSRLWGGRYAGQEQKWLALRFTGRDADIDLATAEPEFEAWRWSTPAETLAGIVGFKRPVYELVLSEFEPYFRQDVA